jgi:hypothetical protein
MFSLLVSDDKNTTGDRFELLLGCELGEFSEVKFIVNYF